MRLCFLIISIVLTGCADVENPLTAQLKHKPVNQVYDSRALVGTGGFNPKYIPILKK